MSLLLRLLVPLARSRCSTRPVRQAPRDGVEGDPGADDSAADDQDVELLGGHRPQGSMRASGLSALGSATPPVSLRQPRDHFMRLPTVRAHVGVVTCAALAATVLGTPFADVVDAPASARPAIQLSGGEPSAPAIAEPEPEPEPRRFTLVMGGDLLWHDTVWQSAAADARGGAAYDFDPMFADVKPLIERADLALCHEEVPFAAPGVPLQSYPVFAAPPEIAPWIASMGWDACTTASNHALDQGFDGLAYTATCWSRWASGTSAPSGPRASAACP